MATINFTPFPNLTTERLNLRQVTIKDENEFYILKSDPQVLKFINNKPKTFEESCQFINRINEEMVKNEWILWGITLKDEDKLIGTICLWNISEEQSKAEVGYELIPSYQGKGFMQEAITEVIKYGFESMKLDSIEAVPNSCNSKSVGLLERNGFVKTGSFKEDSYLDGSVWDMAIYTLVNRNV